MCPRGGVECEARYGLAQIDQEDCILQGQCNSAMMPGKVLQLEPSTGMSKSKAGGTDDASKRVPCTVYSVRLGAECQRERGNINGRGAGKCQPGPVVLMKVNVTMVMEGGEQRVEATPARGRRSRWYRKWSVVPVKR